MVTTDILRLSEAPAGVFQPTKTTALEVARKVVEKVEDGDVDALDMLIKVQWLQAMLDEVKKGIRESALNEAEKYGSQPFDLYGANVQVKEMGTKYDYSGNETWDNLQSRIDCLRTEQKAVELILRAQGSCSKQSTTSVVVTLKK